MDKECDIMGMLDNFSPKGDFQLAHMLESEGFKQNANGFCKIIQGTNKRVCVYYRNNRFICELRTMEGELLHVSEIATPKKEYFFEQYELAIHTVDDFLQGKHYD